MFSKSIFLPTPNSALRSTLALALTLTTVLALNSVAFSTPSFAQDQDLPFTQSQSIIRFKNNQIGVFDPSAGSFVDPQQNSNFAFTSYYYEQMPVIGKISTLGSNFFFTEDGRFFTTSSTGFFTAKGLMPFKPAAAGATWFAKKTTKGDNGEIVTIDQKGFFYEKGVTLPPTKSVGGTFFITHSGELSTITAQGYLYEKVSCKQCNLKSANIQAGGNYFIITSQNLNDQKVVSISAENGGTYEPYLLEAPVTQLGGNYFITSKRTQSGVVKSLYGISKEGWIQKPLPLPKDIAQVGYSMVVFTDQTFLTIDSAGLTHAEAVKTDSNGKYTIIRDLRLNPVMDITPNFLKR